MDESDLWMCGKVNRIGFCQRGCRFMKGRCNSYGSLATNLQDLSVFVEGFGRD